MGLSCFHPHLSFLSHIKGTFAKLPSFLRRRETTGRQGGTGEQDNTTSRIPLSLDGRGINGEGDPALDTGAEGNSKTKQPTTCHMGSRLQLPM